MTKSKKRVISTLSGSGHDPSTTSTSTSDVGVGGIRSGITDNDSVINGNGREKTGNGKDEISMGNTISSLSDKMEIENGMEIIAESNATGKSKSKSTTFGPGGSGGSGDSGGLRPIFTQEAFSGILEHIILDLPFSSIASALRICKNVNHVISTSSIIQLVLRKLYHSLPDIPPPPAGLPKQNHKPGPTLQRIIQREKNLAALTPTDIRCLHVPRGLVQQMEDGYMLMSESFAKKRRDDYPPEAPPEYEIDGWSVWKLPGEEEVISDGVAKKHQGMWRWRTEVGLEGGRVECLAFCPQDNVVVVARRLGPFQRDDMSRDVFSNRLYFYQMRPTDSSESKNLAAFAQGGQPHPSAALHCIEILSPKYDDDPRKLPNIDLQIIPGGRVAVTMWVPQLYPEACSGVWDWKRGLCLGIVEPADNFGSLFKTRFLTQDWVVGTTFRHIDDPDDEFDFTLPVYEGDIGYSPCIEVFSLLDPKHEIKPRVLGIGASPGSQPQAWSMSNLPQMGRICIHQLPTCLVMEMETLSPGFLPIDFQIQCPLLPSRALQTAMGTISFSLIGTVDDLLTGARNYTSVQGSFRARFLISECLAAVAAKNVIKNIRRERGLSRRSHSTNRRSSGMTEHDENNSNEWTDEEDEDENEDDDEDEVDKRPHWFLPWSDFSRSIHLRKDHPTLGPTWGSRVITVSSCDGRCMKKYNGVHPEEITPIVRDVLINIYDYNQETLNGYRIDRPLGTFRLGKTTSPLTYNDKKTTTQTHSCPLTKPILLPTLEFISEREKQTKTETTESAPMFVEDKMSSGLSYTKRTGLITFDPTRQLEKMFFDGDRIVFGMRNGANIISF
ncbi:hypothetical protein M231_07767 [Tremella mesenterica]|uniref:F-box domain-containing protein n=1 Tax=Tremella mesenterica TaxID=5217 RepID=A0A4Q1BBF3_TREME|nr:hypothetical protein M231_07767 [Tremella mesenterica]